MRKPLRIRYLLYGMVVMVVFGTTVLAADQPVASSGASSAGVFKQAKKDLPEIFREIATSLRAEGNPVPYLRHVKTELSRVEHEYQVKYGKAPRSFGPAYMTDDYLDHLEKNWNVLAPKLGLADLVRQIGSLMDMDLANNDSTLAILHSHQTRVFDFLAGQAEKGAISEDLETALLTESRQAGFSGPKAASTGAHGIAEVTNVLFAKLDRSLSAKDAATLKAAISSVFVDVGRMAQAELEAGIVESAISEEPAHPYTVADENALTDDEKTALTALLAKPRFTKADFAALDRFYSGPYHRLSERGRDELSHRVWAGMRK